MQEKQPIRKKKHKKLELIAIRIRSDWFRVLSSLAK